MEKSNSWLAALAVAALVVAIVAVFAVVVLGKTSDLDKQVRSLRSRNVDLAQQVRAAAKPSAPDGSLTQLQSTVSDLDSKITTVESSVKALKGKVGFINECLPEVQSEMDSLSVDVEGTGTAYASTDRQVSTHCSKLVYPQSNGDGE